MSGRLVCDREVGSSPSLTLQAAPPALLGPGDCHELGEVRPRAIQQGLVSQDVDRHHPREGFPKGLLDCQVP